MQTDTVIILAVGAGLTLLTVVPAWMRHHRREHQTRVREIEAVPYGLHEPVSLHPVVDLDRCIGIASCVTVCPEDVLGIRDGHAVAVSPARCIGHGLCERICPMEAIRLVFGTETRGVDLPRVKENFETNVTGLYIVGELGGMGLIANAFEQGRQCVDGILAEEETGPEGLLDLVIVGCGPAGLSASLTALANDLDFVTLEKEDVGGTVRHYPRKKLVMTRPVRVPGYGKLPASVIHKEELIEIWHDVVDRVGLTVNTSETVRAVERIGPHHFRITSDRGTYSANRVVLAIGRRGVPRKLGVPGEEESARVSYSLREPEAFVGDRILVVGGGDSAVEAALALSEQPGNEVKISYRGSAFSRIKPANLDGVRAAIAKGSIEVHWETRPVEIGPDRVVLSADPDVQSDVAVDQVFVFIGGELPSGFLRASGVEIERHFGAP